MANHDDKIEIKIEFDEGDNYVSLNSHATNWSWRTNDP